MRPWWQESAGQSTREWSDTERRHGDCRSPPQGCSTGPKSTCMGRNRLRLGKNRPKQLKGTVSSTRAVPETVTLPNRRTCKTHSPGDIGENIQETLALVLGE